MEPKKKTLLFAAAGLSLPLISTGVALANDDGATDSDPAETSPADLDAYSAYWEAGYSYDQLVQLSEEWRVDVAEAKARAGTLIGEGSSATLDDLVGAPAGPDTDAAPAGSTDRFWQAGYTYDDAVALATEWQLDDPYDAKVRAAGLIDDGKGHEVEHALGDD